MLLFSLLLLVVLLGLIFLCAVLLFQSLSKWCCLPSPVFCSIALLGLSFFGRCCFFPPWGGAVFPLSSSVGSCLLVAEPEKDTDDPNPNAKQEDQHDPKKRRSNGKPRPRRNPRPQAGKLTPTHLFSGAVPLSGGLAFFPLLLVALPSFPSFGLELRSWAGSAPLALPRSGPTPAAGRLGQVDSLAGLGLTF